METMNTIMYNSHCSEATWKQVIRDTVSGISIDETAGSLLLSHSTIFNMRHKILLALESEEVRQPTVLEGVCELDDTYVLESLKGTKIPTTYWRKPRKHGAVAQKRGISNEYISIRAGVQRDGDAYSLTVTSSTPSKEDIAIAFKGNIGESALIMCDGTASYNSIGGSCKSVIINVSKETRGGFSHIKTIFSRSSITSPF